MELQANDLKATFERIWDGVWHSPDAAQVIAENLTDDFQMYIAPRPQPLDKAAFTGMVAEWQQAFPDGRMEILDSAAQGDRAWVYWVSTGTHSDTYLGIPATGKKVEYKGASVLRLENGKVAQYWDVPDALSLLTQLGGIRANG